MLHYFQLRMKSGNISAPIVKLSILQLQALESSACNFCITEELT